MKKIIFLFVFFYSKVLFSNDYNIVFVHIGLELPTYLETAIFQARLFNEDCPIILIANKEALLNFPHNFLSDKKIKLVPCEELIQTDAHQLFLKHNSQSENFWKYTSERFLFLNDLITQYDLRNVFHFENDVLLYADLQAILPTFEKNYQGIAATFDNDQRCIAGFMFIRDSLAMNKLADFFGQHAEKHHNDMELIALFKNSMNKDVIDYLPIIMSSYTRQYPLKSLSGHTTNQPERFTNYFEDFNSIFDAAAIGQYFDGSDPNIHPEVKTGFINESCLFNPSLLKYTWFHDEKNRKVPYAIFQNIFFKINNLHIHSKRLSAFLST